MRACTEKRSSGCYLGDGRPRRGQYEGKMKGCGVVLTSGIKKRQDHDGHSLDISALSTDPDRGIASFRG